MAAAGPSRSARRKQWPASARQARAGANASSITARRSASELARPASVRRALGSRNSRLRAIGDGATLAVEGVLPLARLQAVLDPQGAGIADYGHGGDYRVVRIFPHRAQRMPAEDAQRGRSSDRLGRSAAELGGIAFPSLDIGGHVE